MKRKTPPLHPLNQDPGVFPEFCLGTWRLGGEGFGPSDFRQFSHFLDISVEQGLRYFDTAGLYGKGKAERLLAPVIKQDRQAFFVTSKVGLKWQGNSVLHDGSEDTIRQSCMQSLDRLSTSYIDLLLYHWPDTSVPLEETIAALQALKEDGLVRYIGVSNFSTALLNALPTGSIDAFQCRFNPFHAQKDVIEQGYAKGLYQMAYSPLEQGLLTGANLNKKDVRHRNCYVKDPLFLNWRKTLFDLASSYDGDLVALIYYWVLSHQEINTVVFGAHNVAHLRSLLSFLDMDPFVKESALWSHLNSRFTLGE